MKDQKPDLNRRSLLKAITIGSAAGAAIAATGVSAAQANEPVEAKSAKRAITKQRISAAITTACVANPGDLKR